MPHTRTPRPAAALFAIALLASAALTGCACPDRVEIVNNSPVELFIEVQMRHPGKLTPRLCIGELAKTLPPGEQWSTTQLRNLEPVRSDMPGASGWIQLRVRREHSIFPETIALRRRNLDPQRITFTIDHDEIDNRFIFDAIDNEGRQVEIQREEPTR